MYDLYEVLLSDDPMDWIAQRQILETFINDEEIMAQLNQM